VRYRDTVVRVRAPLITGYGGQEKRDWPNAARTTIRANVQPDRTVELNDQRQTTVTRWRLFCGPAEEIVATDRVEWDGRTLEVDGDVELWKRSGAPHHQEAVLRGVSDG
jgi:hypothetical protein